MTLRLRHTEAPPGRIHEYLPNLRNVEIANRRPEVIIKTLEAVLGGPRPPHLDRLNVSRVDGVDNHVELSAAAQRVRIDETSRYLAELFAILRTVSTEALVLPDIYTLGNEEDVPRGLLSFLAPMTQKRRAVRSRLRLLDVGTAPFSYATIEPTSQLTRITAGGLPRTGCWIPRDWSWNGPPQAAIGRSRDTWRACPDG